MKQMEIVNKDVGMRWEKVILKTVAKISAGQSAPKDSDFSVKDGLPFIRAGHLEQLIAGKNIFSLPTINKEHSLKNRLKVLNKGSILFAKSGMSAMLNRVYLVEQEIYYVSHLASVTPDNSVLDSRFCYYFLKHFKTSKLIKDSAYPSIGLPDIEKVEIPLPPLPIQKRIAEILDAADALKRKDQELLKKYDELAQAIFIDMFGDPVKNEKGWEVKRLDELLLKGEKISYGVVQPGDDFPNGVPIVRVGDFKLMKIDKTNLKKINPEIETTYNRTRLKGDEILIACVGSVGKIALADESLKGFNIVRATAKVRVDHNIINRTYLAFHLSQISIQNYFIAETRTSSQPTLNIKQIEETKILVPPIRIQNQFNLLSTDLLKQIEMVNDSNSDGLFQTLIQKAFKGELVAE